MNKKILEVGYSDFKKIVANNGMFHKLFTFYLAL